MTDIRVIEEAYNALRRAADVLTAQGCPRTAMDCAKATAGLLDILSAAGEEAEQARIESFHGAESPQTCEERRNAAWEQKFGPGGTHER